MKMACVCSIEPHTRVIPSQVGIKAGRPLDHPVKPDGDSPVRPDDDTAGRMVTAQSSRMVTAELRQRETPSYPHQRGFPRRC